MICLWKTPSLLLIFKKPHRVKSAVCVVSFWRLEEFEFFIGRRKFTGSSVSINMLFLRYDIFNEKQRDREDKLSNFRNVGNFLQHYIYSLWHCISFCTWTLCTREIVVTSSTGFLNREPKERLPLLPTWYNSSKTELLVYLHRTRKVHRV